jgi:hypothetical protein
LRKRLRVHFFFNIGPSGPKVWSDKIISLYFFRSRYLTKSNKLKMIDLFANYSSYVRSNKTRVDHGIWLNYSLHRFVIAFVIGHNYSKQTLLNEKGSENVFRRHYKSFCCVQRIIWWTWTSLFFPSLHALYLSYYLLQTGAYFL